MDVHIGNGVFEHGLPIALRIVQSGAADQGGSLQGGADDFVRASQRPGGGFLQNEAQAGPVGIAAVKAFARHRHRPGLDHVVVVVGEFFQQRRVARAEDDANFCSRHLGDAALLVHVLANALLAEEKLLGLAAVFAAEDAAGQELGAAGVFLFAVPSR